MSQISIKAQMKLRLVLKGKRAVINNEKKIHLLYIQLAPNGLEMNIHVIIIVLTHWHRFRDVLRMGPF